MNDHYLLLTILGFVTLFMTWLPSISQKIKVSSPVILLPIGIVLYLVNTPLGWTEFLWSDKSMMVFSEAIVIIPLMVWRFLEIERLLIVVWIILFGGTIMNGILELTDWKGILFSLAFVLIVRPLAALIALVGIKDSFKNKLAISFLGIRGVGAIFYFSWAFLQTNFFENKNELYAISAYIILFSILIHGITAPSIIDYFKRNRVKHKLHDV
jgi:NhaP-type Na+/H+ or K+/H+ antiporter